MDFPLTFCLNKPQKRPLRRVWGQYCSLLVKLSYFILTFGWGESDTPVVTRTALQSVKLELVSMTVSALLVRWRIANLITLPTVTGLYLFCLVSGSNMAGYFLV